MPGMLGHTKHKKKGGEKGIARDLKI